MFLLGAIIGLIFFAIEFGLPLANPTNTNWIFYPITHDTAQHFLGWEFFRQASSGATITSLATPIGLPITYMDGIPLLALPFKLFANVLPTNFQYFGAWALLCYILLGGLAAILMRKIWCKVFAKYSGKSLWQILFVAAGSLIIVLNPVTLARTLYHSALAAQWLILLAIILIWDAKKFAKWWQFTLVWSAFLVVATLIHPYFLPMLGAMMVIAVLRNLVKFDKRSVAKLLAKIIVPVVCAGATFYLLGGFSLGGGAAEVYDLPDKGFNLISFLMDNGWSAVVPGIPAHSGSPETMMWLGLGVWLLAILAIIFGVKLWKKLYRNSRNESKKISFADWLWQAFVAKFRVNFSRNLTMAVVAFALLCFAIGVSVEIGPLRIFTWRPPTPIWDFWNIFRAAAREAWPFYFAAILLIIFAAGKIIFAKFGKKNTPKIFALVILLAAGIQFVDIFFSPMATNKRENFAKVQSAGSRYFTAPKINDLVTTQQNIVVLDKGFATDQSGFYELGQAALRNKMTMNLGYFSRVPDAIFTQQAAWRTKILTGKLTAQDLRENLFTTKDANFAKQASRNYTIIQRGNFYFIAAKL